MKKILVYYSYSHNNAGDMAICLGLMDLLSEIPDCQITFISRYGIKDKEFQESKNFIHKYHPSVLVKPGYISFNRSSGLLSKICSYAKGFFVSSFPCFQKRMRKDIQESDLVLFNGGNYLRSNSVTDKMRLKALFFPIKYAKSINKKIICMPQSTSNARNKQSLKILGRIISYFDKVFIRDPISFNYFSKNGFCANGNIAPACDLAFFMKNRFISNNHQIDVIKPNKRNIAINMRITGIGDIGTIDSSKIESIKNTYSKLIKEHPESNFVFICQTTKDGPVMQDFFNNLSSQGINNISFYSTNDAYELKYLYSRCDLLISMRLHASIISISSGTPVIGFAFDEWGFKNKGILNQFGYDCCSDGSSVIEAFDCWDNTKENINKNLIETCKNTITESIKEKL